TVTIDALKQEPVLNQGKNTQMWVMYFRETDKKLVMKSANGNILANLFPLSDAEREQGLEDSDAWIGKRVQLWLNPDIEMAGKLVGGIRSSAVKTARATTQPA